MKKLFVLLLTFICIANVYAFRSEEEYEAEFDKYVNDAVIPITVNYLNYVSFAAEVNECSDILAENYLYDIEEIIDKMDNFADRTNGVIDQNNVKYAEQAINEIDYLLKRFKNKYNSSIGDEDNPFVFTFTDVEGNEVKLASPKNVECLIGIYDEYVNADYHEAYTDLWTYVLGYMYETFCNVENLENICSDEDQEAIDEEIDEMLSEIGYGDIEEHRDYIAESYKSIKELDQSIKDYILSTEQDISTVKTAIANVQKKAAKKTDVKKVTKNTKARKTKTKASKTKSANKKKKDKQVKIKIKEKKEVAKKL